MQMGSEARFSQTLNPPQAMTLSHLSSLASIAFAAEKIALAYTTQTDDRAEAKKAEAALTLAGDAWSLARQIGEEDGTDASDLAEITATIEKLRGRALLIRTALRQPAKVRGAGF